ncbi:mechanosensitive ion channel family protein [Candidatus Avoscillospira sp. LCP25S3_F1]|uniref:mechanosensitive ion channel family protein n=1 Tax=Candidatus Avoscillospira sp. LCP25S3_F1 TaxID=3438825 RepID=UPI003F90481D
MSVDTSAITKVFGTISAARILPAILTFVVAYFVLKIVVKVVGNLLDRTPMEKTIVRFIRSALRIVMWVLLSVITASALGIDTTSMVALISVASLAISLSVQGALSNVAGGITLLSTHPFKVGDFVEVGGMSGTVREIGMTYTTLTTADQKEIFVPNSEVSSSKIINYTMVGTRRVDLTFTASYDDEVETVKDALRKAADLPQVLEDPALFVAVSKYGDSAIEYVLRAWTTSDDYWTVYYRIIENVKICFDEAGITMTYPHLNVHLSAPDAPATKKDA